MRASRVQYSMAMAGMPSMGGRVEAEPMGDGEYRADANIEMAGTWKLAIEASDPRARRRAPRARCARVLRGSSSSAPGRSARTRSPTTRADASLGARGAPGKCPICGMDLVPVTKAEAKSGAVRVDPQRLQKIGVRFAEVERAPLVRTVRALGRVTWDETKLVDVTLKVRGFVRDLRADALGARVAKGRRALLDVQPRALRGADRVPPGAAQRRTSRSARARARLRLWDVADRDVAALEQRGEPLEALPVRSPANGVLVEKNVVDGAAFEPGMRLFRIAPLERVWVEAEVYASDLPLVSVGQKATISAPYLPGRALEARVAYVLPRSRARRGRRACASSSATATSRCGPRCSSTSRCTRIWASACSCPLRP